MFFQLVLFVIGTPVFCVYHKTVFYRLYVLLCIIVMCFSYMYLLIYFYFFRKRPLKINDKKNNKKNMYSVCVVGVVCEPADGDG